MALRTLVRDSPDDSASSVSLGISVPGASSPLMIFARNSSASCR